jgi:hypothetical protein
LFVFRCHRRPLPRTSPRISALVSVQGHLCHGRASLDLPEQLMSTFATRTSAATFPSRVRRQQPQSRPRPPLRACAHALPTLESTFSNIKRVAVASVRSGHSSSSPSMTQSP